MTIEQRRPVDARHAVTSPTGLTLRASADCSRPRLPHCGAFRSLLLGNPMTGEPAHPCRSHPRLPDAARALPTSAAHRSAILLRTP